MYKLSLWGHYPYRAYLWGFYSNPLGNAHPTCKKAHNVVYRSTSVPKVCSPHNFNTDKGIHFKLYIHIACIKEKCSDQVS